MALKLVTESVSEYKIFENMQQAKHLLKELNIPEDHPQFIAIKNLLGMTPEAQKAKVKQRPGYMGKFTEWVFKDRQSIDALKDLYELMKAHPEVNFKIEKPESYGYKGETDSRPELEALYDYIQLKSSEQKAKSIIKSIPSVARQKVTPQLTELLANNSDKAKELKSFFAKKGGRYSRATSEQLYQDVRDFIDNLNSDFNLEETLKKIKASGKEGKKGDYQIVYASPELLILQPLTYKMSCAVGSRSWCISTAESHWNSYVDLFSNQYFIYDFTKSPSDKKSMIGVTVAPAREGSSEPEFSDMHYKDDSVASKDYIRDLLSDLG